MFGEFLHAVGKVAGQEWNNWSGTTDANERAALEAEKARVFSSAEAQKERDFQTMMSNTAYQRQVEDLKAAGLNPAAVSGNGATTPQVDVPTGYAAAQHGGGSGGFAGLVAKAALAAIGVGLNAKMLNTAKMAAGSGSSAKIVQQVSNEATSAMLASHRSQLLKEVSRMNAYNNNNILASFYDGLNFRRG